MHFSFGNTSCPPPAEWLEEREFPPLILERTGSRKGKAEQYTPYSLSASNSCNKTGKTRQQGVCLDFLYLKTLGMTNTNTSSPVCSALSTTAQMIFHLVAVQDRLTSNTACKSDKYHLFSY